MLFRGKIQLIFLLQATVALFKARKRQADAEALLAANRDAREDKKLKIEQQHMYYMMYLER